MLRYTSWIQGGALEKERETDLLLHVKVTQVSRVDSKSSIYDMVFGWPLKGCLQVVSVQFRK